MKQSVVVELDTETLNKLDTVLEARAKHDHLEAAPMIDLISGFFLGTPYRANMLQGAQDLPEQLVVDLRGLDCFTFLDYVEALRKSKSRQEFVNNVILTRYAGGNISFLDRKHFFSDWAYSKGDNLADDITARVSPDALTVEKNLNEKADGSSYLPGLPVVKHTITYIPKDAIDETVVSRLRSGDFIGIYTKLAGLDVTHVGFFIMTPNGPVLRNASSRKENYKVVDSPFMKYVANTPGIIVFRPKN